MQKGVLMFDLDFILTSLGFIVPVILVIIIITQGYVKAPPDHAYIISGLRKQPRVLIGRAGIKIPFFEQLDKLYLGQITVDIKTDEYIPTNDFINVMVDAVAKIRVADDDERMKLAMRNFLNKEPANIAADLQDSLQGNMREIIGTLTLRAINTDRDSFSDQVMIKASKDMEKLGIDILSCNIQNVTTDSYRILVWITPPKSARTHPSQRQRQNVILPLPRQLRTMPPMTQGWLPRPR